MATKLTLIRYPGTPGNPRHIPANLISPGMDGILIENDEVIEITAFGKTVTLHRGGCRIDDNGAGVPYDQKEREVSAARLLLDDVNNSLSKVAAHLANLQGN